MLCSFSALMASPEAIYVTLSEDPSQSMYVHWIEKTHKYCSLFYQKPGDLVWKEIDVLYKNPLESSPYFACCLKISDLEPSTYYSFYLKGDSNSYVFKTLPKDLSTPLQVAIGGDLTESYSLFRRMNKVVAAKNPDFAILGGDIAYSNGFGLIGGKRGSISRWVSFFSTWQKTMRGERDRLIPIAATLGNHDVGSIDRKEGGEKAFYLKLFCPYANIGYRTLDIGREASFFLLDSGHLSSVESQVPWLQESLAKRKDRVYKIPVYHVSAYPASRPMSSHLSTRLRECFCPLFEEYGVKVVFEHHNHSYKRTHPMLEGKIDPLGIVYLGEGGWGSPPRPIKESPFYLEKSAASSNVSFLRISDKSLFFEAINEKAEVIDTWSYHPKEKAL